MKTIFKILPIIGVGFLMYFSFVIGQVQLIEGKHIFSPYLDTKFAIKYTPEDFNKIKIGMTVEEVKEVIGEPLYTGDGYQNQSNLNLHYTGDGKLLSKRNSTNGTYSDLAWYRSSVEIDENKKVISIDKGWSFD